ncbi:hypothetical protein ABK040_005049 [Willaertia magna]
MSQHQEEEFKEIKPTLTKEEIEKKERFFFEESDIYFQCFDKANKYSIFHKESFDLYRNLCFANICKKNLKKKGISCIDKLINEEKDLTKEEQIDLIEYLNLANELQNYYLKPLSFRNIAPNVLQLLFTNNFRNKNLNDFKLNDNVTKENALEIYDKVASDILQKEFNELNDCVTKTNHVRFCKKPLLHYMFSLDTICNKDYIKNCLKNKVEDIENCSIRDYLECSGKNPNANFLEMHFRQKFGAFTK